MKKIAILQSNYIPWKGYFDLISFVDEFILYDDMQFTRRDWRNRNKIKTPNGTEWLTVPVFAKGKYDQRICDTKISNNLWANDHWKALYLNYKKSKYFFEISEWLEPLYMNTSYNNISQLNIMFIKTINQYLEINTNISFSSNYKLIEGKNQRLISICKQAGATEYVSGPKAKEYLNENEFSESGINIKWFDYKGYPEYEQLWGAFTHNVTILDLLFNCGKNSNKYLKKY